MRVEMKNLFFQLILLPQFGQNLAPWVSVPHFGHKVLAGLGGSCLAPQLGQNLAPRVAVPQAGQTPPAAAAGDAAGAACP